MTKKAHEKAATADIREPKHSPKKKSIGRRAHAHSILFSFVWIRTRIWRRETKNAFHWLRVRLPLLLAISSLCCHCCGGESPSELVAFWHSFVRVLMQMFSDLLTRACDYSAHLNAFSATSNQPASCNSSLRRWIIWKNRPLNYDTPFRWTDEIQYVNNFHSFSLFPLRAASVMNPRHWNILWHTILNVLVRTIQLSSD